MTTTLETLRYAPGTFCWTELQSTDAQAAKGFYRELFGWTIHEDPLPSGGTYIMFGLDGKNVCAGFQMAKEMQDQGMPSNWSSYLTVDDADAAAAKAKQLGGTVVAEPFDVMDFGRMAVLQDPTGAFFSLWQPKAHQGAHIQDEIGTMCWNELITTDTAKAGAFYTDLFGWTAQAIPEMDYTFFNSETHFRESKNAGGMMAKTPEMGNAPSNWLVYFGVADCDGACAKVETLGGKVLMPGQDIPPGRFAVVQDPQGAVFAVIQFKE